MSTEIAKLPGPKLSDEERDALLSPISEEKPAGDSLRYEGTYDRVAEGRRADDASLPMGVWERDLKSAEWDKVERICVEALCTRSKDLQVVLWLTEAWTERYGLVGFREGLELCYAMSDLFWDDMHPQIRDGDVDFRVAPYVWLNESLTYKLKRASVTQPSGSLEPYGLLDWDSALRLEQMRSRDAARYEREDKSGAVTKDRFLESARKTRPDVLRARAQEILRMQVVLKDLDDFVDERLGNDGPSFGKVRKALEDLANLVLKQLFGVLGLSLQEEEPEEEPEEENMEQPEEEVLVRAGATPTQRLVIGDRHHAYRILTQVADYLARTEPHSPTPLLVRRAVSWGDMTLMELMQEFIRDPNQLAAINELLGLGSRR